MFLQSKSLIDKGNGSGNTNIDSKGMTATRSLTEIMNTVGSTRSKGMTPSASERSKLDLSKLREGLPPLTPYRRKER
jgi:hypothetical protein